MKRSLAFGVIVIAVFGVPGGAALLIAGQPRVSQDAIQTSVTRTAELIDSAWELPVAATFNADVTWQSNGSRCGPASVANTFRSIGEEETTEAEVLAGTGKCWTGFCIIGLTLDELAEVARTNTRRKVSVLRNLSADAFREHMKRANDPGRRYIVNFTREKIFGAGAGHFSPVGGYLEDEDMVFVLDVNEDFKPWLVERERLFSAMDTIDSGGDKKRGLLLIE
ncbi:MAG: phytochelatin synthase [Mesorhizobium sp.]|nr:MAG: phytochelatin synthase [Mesorhizobium sp.]